jgi:hypothetical protein
LIGLNRVLSTKTSNRVRLELINLTINQKYVFAYPLNKNFGKKLSGEMGFKRVSGTKSNMALKPELGGIIN